MAENPKKLSLTNVQRAYLIGRTGAFELGGCSTHVYYEFLNDSSPEHFDKALNEIISEQQMLRAIINSQGEEIILDEVPEYHSRVYDWTDKSEEDIDNLVNLQREKYSHEVMSSDEWPLFRFEFAKLPSGKNYLFVSFDLLIVDAGSFATFGKEMYEKYNGIENNTPVGSFEKYLNLLETRKTKAKYINDKSFWENVIDDMPPAPNIPMTPSVDDEKNIFKRIQFFIDSETWSNTKERLANMNVSPNVGVLAAYADVLGYWSNQERFTLNLPMTNLIRRKKDMERVLGDFTEEMLLPLKRNKHPQCFEDYAKYVNSEFMKCFKHSHFDGLEVMASMRSKTADNVKMPIVYTGMISDKSEFDNADFFGEMIYGVSQTPQVTLDCQVFETHGKLKVVWDYIEKMFVPDEINSMFNQFIALISAIGNAKLNAVDIVKVSDKQLDMLAKYNNTCKNIPSVTLLDLFYNTVSKCAEKTAISDYCSSITYKELNEKSDYVADVLIQKGVKPNDRVAVIGNRCKESVVNILAVLKVGAAYVPINPEYPDERRNYILSNSSCVYVLDSDNFDYNAYKSVQFTPICRTALDEAYIIYTSGSTGVPKGVVISHDSVCNTIIDINERFDISSDDKILSVSSFGFDLSVYDMFGAIAVGAEVVIVKDNKDIKNIARIITEKSITVWNSVPSIMELVIDSLPDAYTNNSLRKVLLSGDWIPVQLPDRIKEKYQNSSVISLGGATEGSIWSIYYEVTDTNGFNSIPYGYPLSNQFMYLLDENGNQVPYEVEAEICIGGRGVALRYDNNREKTDASFINHEKFGYIYKTGDFGIMKRDGYMEFKGRRDQQVKIHGYRVELGEIEAALQNLESVQKAVVDINKNENHSYDILAYIISNIKESPEDLYSAFNYNAYIENYVNTLKLSVSINDLEALNKQFEKICTCYMKKFLAYYGNFKKAGDMLDIDKFVEKNNIQTKYKNLLTLWLRELCNDTYIKAEKGKYVLMKDFIEEDIDKLWRALDNMNGSEQLQALKYYIRTCCENHMRLFTGEIMPLSLFYQNSSSEVAKNIYVENPISEYTNCIAVNTISEIVRQNNSFDKPFKILEIGAGIGSVSEQLFSRLANCNIEYDFTDISEHFLNSASERFAEYKFLRYRLLDINKDFQVQGCSYNNYDMVLGVNVVHDADCLDDTIKYIKDILKPGGYFIMVETTHNLRSQMASFGFLEGLNPVYNDIRNETKTAFLNEEQWTSMLCKHKMLPNNYCIKDKEIQKVIWQNVFVARNTLEINIMPEEDIINHLRTLFPDYMIPSKVFRIDDIPLSYNGKVDKKKLSRPIYSAPRSVYKEPTTDMEIKLTKIWQNALNIAQIGIKDNFFELGGDSLNAIKIVTMSEKEGIAIQLADLYKCSTIEELAKIANYAEENAQYNEISNIYEGLNDDDLESILSAL